jgi:urease accessory protein
VLVLGLIIASAFRAPLAGGMCLAGVFALFHGHAHGNDIAAGAPAFATLLGFTISTALLHLAGIGLGRVLALSRSAIPHRIVGGLMAACGAALIANFGFA